MPRKPRVEYAGAVYHVMSRGNRAQKVFRGDDDCRMFLKTLGDACERTGWRVHAYALMGNHYHLLLETPEANLVAGMQWVQGTYTRRFNVRHHERGHLFQGRYKAIPVEAGSGYFSVVANYIHLNPARTKGYDFVHNRLVAYRWSSYPAYLDRSLRPGWLCTSRVLDDLGLVDTPTGRRRYGEYMEGRVDEMRHSDQPWKADENWQRIRRGWHIGGEEFRQELLDHVDGALKKGRRDSFGGEAMREHGEAQAEAWILMGMEALGLSESDLVEMKKNCSEKYALACLVRRNTCVRPAWIKARLHMGTATGFAAFLKRMEQARHGEWGYAAWSKVKRVVRSVGLPAQL